MRTLPEGTINTLRSVRAAIVTLRRCNWNTSTSSDLERCWSGCRFDETKTDGRWDTRASSVCRLKGVSWVKASLLG